MNRFTQLLILMLLTLCAQFVAGQQNYDVSFQTTTVKDGEKHLDKAFSSQALEKYVFDRQYYLILQFKDIPTPELHKHLADKGVKLLGYLPNYAYWASIPVRTDWNELPVRSVILPKPVYKLALPLYRQLLSEHLPGLLPVQAFPLPGIKPEQLREQLAKSGFSIEELNERSIQLELSPDQITRLAASPAIMFLETLPPDPLPEDTEARSLHGMQVLYQSTGLDLDGSGVVITTADDGKVNHPDLKNRVIHHLEADDPQHHSDMVLGILTGAGNIDPTAIGIAPGAKVHLYDYLSYDHVDQAIANFNAYGATITLTAFGEGCGGQYGSSAIAVDDQVYQNPHFVHCFSAGNEADESCSDAYGQVVDDQGFYYGNITGGRKAAKNVITVGNLHADDRLMTLSSRGPANDGRIKPDLCAFGQGQKSTHPEDTYRTSGGSSAAVPVVAGAAAVLTQLYEELKPNEIMPSDLLKPILLNTAEDLGRRGPDFEYGWGRLQIDRAAEILTQDQYFSGDVLHSIENIHHIHIPAGAMDLRIMLYWHDPAASPGAGKALVNDLDLVVQSPGGTRLRPWVLSTAAHIDSIRKPAYRGVDRINNVEQVGIDFPAVGNYQIRVKGHLIPEGPQSYYLVYSYRQKALELKYPVGEERFSPGETQVIRWDAFGLDTSFDLEYRLQGGGWNQIATDIPSELRLYNWQVPEQLKGLAEIRIRSGSHQAVSTAPFSILAIPEFDFLYESERTAWIEWTPVEGADSYEVYKLGDQYMELLERTSDNRLFIHTHPDTINWYSVCARRSDGTLGRRAIAKRYLNMPCESMINLKIQFDASPGEIKWAIRNEAGLVVASSNNYDQQNPFTQLEVPTCLAYGCYELIVRDSYGDGLCCENGQGYYELTDEAGSVLASGDTFVHEDRTTFCLFPSTEPPPVIPLSIAIVDHQDASCAGQEDGMVRVQASDGHGNYDYSWSNGHEDSALINVGAGSYEVTVTDGVFTLTKEVQINEPMPLDITVNVISQSCQQNAGGQIAAMVTGGISPYEYKWSNGGQDANIMDLGPGEYTLSVTDANGCEAIRSVSIDAFSPMSLILFEQQASCPENADGKIMTSVFGGRPPYQYRWSNGSQDAHITGLSPGEYSLSVSDANGCETVGSAFIKASSPMMLLLFEQHPSCSENADGRILTSVFGGRPPYQYRWNRGIVGASPSQLSAGNYTLSVTDAKGCQAVNQVQLSARTPFHMDAIIEPVTDDAPGSIELQIRGTRPDYQIVWSDGSTSAIRTGLSAGDYSVTVTDFKGCSQSDTYIVPDESSNTSSDYCVSSGIFSDREWIALVGIKDVYFSSGSDEGYNSHVDHPVDMIAGQAFTLKLEKGSRTGSSLHYWSVWIDFNQNGLLDDEGELVFQNEERQNIHEALIETPDGLTGQTLMRVSMQWGSPPPDPCGQVNWGEVEDFTLNFVQPESQSQGRTNLMPLFETENSPITVLNVWPNPAKDYIRLDYRNLPQESGALFLTNSFGQQVGKWNWADEGTQGKRRVNLPAHVNPGVYYLHLRIGQWQEAKRLVIVR